MLARRGGLGSAARLQASGAGWGTGPAGSVEDG